MALTKDVGALAKLDHEADQFLFIDGDNGAEAAGTPDVTGSTIDLRRDGQLGRFESACMASAIVASTGTPTGITLTCYLQESADDSTWTKIDASEFTVGSASTTTGLGQSPSVDLDNVERYIRLAVEIAFTAGTSPTVDVNNCVMLGEGQQRV